jgi:N-acetylglucosamine kinase-like BadF-type ATPase
MTIVSNGHNIRQKTTGKLQMAQSDGFQKHPENINRNGRPKKGDTITDAIKNILQQEVDTKEGKKAVKELFAKKVSEMALKGDLNAIKLIMQYCDGMPLQKQDININTEVNPFLEAMKENIGKNKAK